MRLALIAACLMISQAFLSHLSGMVSQTLVESVNGTIKSGSRGAEGQYLAQQWHPHPV